MHNRVGTLFGLEQTNLVNCNFFAQAKKLFLQKHSTASLFIFIPHYYQANALSIYTDHVSFAHA